MFKPISMASVLIFGFLAAVPARALEVAPKIDSHPVLDQVFAKYEKAFNAGDAQAIGALWKSDGEFVGPLGNRIVGREAIEKLFQDYFSRNQGAKLSIKVLSLKEEEQGRVVVAEVVPELSPPPAGKLGSNKATMVLIRSGEKWVIEGIQETPDLPASHEHLKALEWMIGSWTSRTAENEKAETEIPIALNTTCQWTANKSFLTRTFAARLQQLEVQGTEIIGWDPQAKTIRSWMFESTGGFAQSTWKADGKQWIIDSSGVLSDGTPISAKNTITLVDNDTLSFVSQSRMKGGEKQPDRGPIVLLRVKEDKTNPTK